VSLGEGKRKAGGLASRRGLEGFGQVDENSKAGQHQESRRACGEGDNEVVDSRRWLHQEKGPVLERLLLRVVGGTGCDVAEMRSESACARVPRPTPERFAVRSWQSGRSGDKWWKWVLSEKQLLELDR
jgi:hypothetical protein